MKIPAKLLAVYRTFSPEVWIAGVMLSAALLVGAWWVLIGAPAQHAKQMAAARVSAAFAASRADAAADAAKAASDNAEADAKTSDIQRENADAIDKAADAATPVPATAGALRSGLCAYDSYRDAPQCVQRARAAGRLGADAGSAVPRGR